MANPQDLEHPFGIIPDRVTSNKSFRVDTSTIAGAGRGIIVLEDVQPGELIFEIKEPMLSVVRTASTPSPEELW